VLPPLDLSRSDPDFLPGPAVIEVPPLILVLPPLPRRPTPRASEPTEPPSGLPLGTPPDLPDRLAAAPAHCPVNWLELYQDWALGADTAEDAAEAGLKASGRLLQAMEPAEETCEDTGGHLFWRDGLALHRVQRSPLEPDEVQDLRLRTGVCCSYTGCADECRMYGHPAGGFFPAGCPGLLEGTEGPLGGFDGCCCLPATPPEETDA